MKEIELRVVSDKSEDHLISSKGKLTNVGIYYGKRKRGRKLLTLVKAGIHLDIEKATGVYTITKENKRTGETQRLKFYDLNEVIVYYRINHAKYSRLLLQYSRMKLRDTAAFGLPPEQAMLTDGDLAKVLEFSRGEILCRYGREEYTELRP